MLKVWIFSADVIFWEEELKKLDQVNSANLLFELWSLVSYVLICFFMPLYIEKINGDVDRPTDQPTNRVNIEQSAFSNVRK